MPFKDPSKHRKQLREYCNRYAKSHSLDVKERTERLKNEKISFLQSLKSRPCMDCGGKFSIVSMDLDHIRGEKRIDVSQMIHRAYTLESVKTEASKCDIVCCNCHRVRTISRKGRKIYPITRLAWIIDEIKGVACCDCNKSFPSECMEFDHRNSLSKLCEVGPLRVQTFHKMGVLLNEIDKCDIVCGNCHRVRTHPEAMTANIVEDMR